MSKLIKWGVLIVLGYFVYKWYVSTTKAAPVPATVAPVGDVGVTNATGITSVPANNKNTPAQTSIVFDDSEADVITAGP